MQLIEFVTKLEDGNIKIPKKYLDSLKNEFKVLILVDEKKIKKEKTTKKKRFTALKIKTK